MNVYVVGGDNAVASMFKRRGWECADNKVVADLFCFTGGADVSPCLYGEKSHPTTGSNMHRDFKEIGEFSYALNKNIPMVGICRGAQFLNVMNGGKMWQDVSEHAVWDTHGLKKRGLDIDNIEYQVTSTHHQMMRASDDGIILAMSTHICHVESYDEQGSVYGTEVVLYEKNKCLCFQPHPEYNGAADDTEALFFDMLKHIIKE